MAAATLEGVLSPLSPEKLAGLAKIQPPAVRARIEALTKPAGGGAPRKSGLPPLPKISDLGIISGELAAGVWFHVKGLRLPVTKNAREHHMALARWDALHREVALIALRPLPMVLHPRRVVVTREYDGNAQDTDNLSRACAYIRDGVAKWLGVDDSPRSGVEWVSQQVKAAGNGVRVEITGEP